VPRQYVLSFLEISRDIAIDQLRASSSSTTSNRCRSAS
jgi:hypothetical protein